jgi:formate dehydrogenase beta subunit
MENKKKIHPGSGRRNALNFNKGRHADDTSILELEKLIPNDFIRQRDMLIECFHLIQDKYKCLSYKHLTALSELTNLPLTEIYETASFYAHFDIIEEGEDTPPPVTIRVCDSITCEMNGCQSLEKKIKEKFSPSVRVVRAPCMGRCHQAPVVEVGKRHVTNATTDKIKLILDSNELKPIIPNFINFDNYKKIIRAMFV